MKLRQYFEDASGILLLCVFAYFAWLFAYAMEPLQ